MFLSFEKNLQHSYELHCMCENKIYSGLEDDNSTDEATPDLGDLRM